MDLLTLIEMCSVAKDVSLVLAMALSFSDGNPYTVRSTTNMDLDAEAPHTRDAGVAELKRLVDAGEAPVAGLLPATPAWAQLFSRPMQDLLDPCAGMSIATAMLDEFEFECDGARGTRKGRDCVVRKYAHSAGLDFFADDVLAYIAEHHLPAPDATVSLDSEALAQAPILVPGVQAHSWGADTILVTDKNTVRPAAPPPVAVSKAPAKPPTVPAPERLPVVPVSPLPSMHAVLGPALRLQQQ